MKAEFAFALEYVDDIEAARRFYEGVVGLTPRRTHPVFVQYEGFAIVEDGVGLVRRFHDGFRRATTRLPARLARPRAVTVVTGEMFGPPLRALLGAVRVDNLTWSVAPIANEWFGRDIAVAGLLTGQDIQSQLAGRALGDEVLVPAVALRDGAGVFLDDLTPADLAASIGTPVTAVEPDAPALLAALLGR